VARSKDLSLNSHKSDIHQVNRWPEMFLLISNTYANELLMNAVMYFAVRSGY
jgi:hypothetical protein